MVLKGARVRRRLHQLILLLYAAAMVGTVSMVVGPAINDIIIMNDPGRGMATVTGVSPTRTAVDYQDEQGRYHSPPTGLLYPTGLGEGQQVWVTYSKRDPDLVKVEGRMWTLSIIPALSVAVVSTILAVIAWVVVSRAGVRKSSSRVTRWSNRC
ncbi:DUF3592 domain-containing protein [Corynebacterium cystitidis]|uniref:DUF3592 domain-containing protein n=1 Tax=Corynebacterium cystitidis DSM 20524 TaxID=1121357 RepID=A0A1H9RFP3_9CORY|nr:hypothetical protein CCYS_02375 [Corynebacterium cystitidis DSM 20524]SER71538.1 hypothetical protein SAMN05661109_00882 [Corynebacterium cystitidis DSM 20524]SNV87334.1 hypothetical membrane protein [Corynebacterium cystitidis]